MSLLFPGNSISVIRGSTQSFKLELSDSATGAVLDISTAVVSLTVKKLLQDVDLVLYKSSNRVDEIEVTCPREGKATIKFIPSDTHYLDAKEYVYDLWLQYADGRRIVVIPPSVFEVLQGVTWLPLK